MMIREEGIVLYMPEYASVRVIECSPPSWMVLLALEEKSLPYKCQELSFARGEHRSPEMLARNPRGTIPVLSDREFQLFETYAIFSYLEYAYPSKPLAPQETNEHVYAILRLHESSHLKSHGMALFAYLMKTPEEALDKDILRERKDQFVNELRFWEDYLEGRDWLAGTSISYADLSVFTYIATAVHLGLSLQTTFPRLAAFVERMKQRPAVQKTWPALWNTNHYSFLSDEGA
tara:strand:+ start:5265 stop:5963 length:699 start_codon:yes stop_codon:yes gene_type:complete